MPVRGADPIIAITSILDGLDSMVSDYSGQPALPDAEGQEDEDSTEDAGGEGEGGGPTLTDLPTAVASSSLASSKSRKVGLSPMSKHQPC